MCDSVQCRTNGEWRMGMQAGEGRRWVGEKWRSAGMNGEEEAQKGVTKKFEIESAE